MDKGSANEKKRHHYIPITYLNKFTDNERKICAYRKDDPENGPLCAAGRDNIREVLLLSAVA
jgi:hypothetical protein